jgi:hypothetical protein
LDASRITGKPYAESDYRQFAILLPASESPISQALPYFSGATKLRLTAESSVVLHKGRTVVVANNFERNVEFAAIGENPLVEMRNSGWSRIEVQVRISVPRDTLGRVYLDHGVARSKRPVPAASSRTSFQDQWIIARFFEL